MPDHCRRLMASLATRKDRRGAAVSDSTLAVTSQLPAVAASISARTGTPVSASGELARPISKGCASNGPKPENGDALRQCMVL